MSCGSSISACEENLQAHSSMKSNEVRDESIRPPCLKAETAAQLESLAELQKSKKYSKYEDITLEDRNNYFNVSCRPITKKAEDDMELISDIITWGERYLFHSEVGRYCCARCSRPLYHSRDKWKGPCVWPSFRRPMEVLSKEGLEEAGSVYEEAISTTEVYPYNNYSVVVKEVYCGGCSLFIGHQFEDGRIKGDNHPEARWRH